MRNLFDILRVRSRCRIGSSLVETVIALLILSIAILAIAAVPLMSSKLMLQTTQREEAMFLAHRALDVLEARSFNISINSEDIIGTFTVKSEKPVFVQAQPEKYVGKATVTWGGVTGNISLTLERRMSKFSNETRRE